MTVNIDGKDYTYSEGDLWNVEVGKGSGSYKVRYSLDTPHKAMLYFNAINIGRGFKKRLTLVQNNDKIHIARVLS